MTAPSSTSLAWFSRGKFDLTITCRRKIISWRDKGGGQTLGNGAEKMVGTIPVFNRDDSLPSGRVRNKKTLDSFCRVPWLGYGRDDWI